MRTAHAVHAANLVTIFKIVTFLGRSFWLYFDRLISVTIYKYLQYFTLQVRYL